MNESVKPVSATSKCSLVRTKILTYPPEKYRTSQPFWQGGQRKFNPATQHENLRTAVT